MENLLHAVAGTATTWGVTAAGAAVVFFAQPSQSFLDGCLGFAAGVMLAASYWSLLAPSIDIAEASGTYGNWSFLPAVVGFLFGAWFVYIADKFFPADSFALVDDAKKKDDDSNMVDGGAGASARATLWDGDGSAFVSSSPPSAAAAAAAAAAQPAARGARSRHQRTQSRSYSLEAQGSGAAPQQDTDGQEGRVSSLTSPAKRWRRTLLLAIAVTVHNIPEGLAVGVGFGSIGSTESATLAGAWALAVGIAIQNFPEGIAVSLPLHRAGFSKWRAFWYGQLSGMVEPMAGVLGCVFVTLAQPALPYALSFAAGAMVYVVLDDIVPEVCAGPNTTLANWAAMVGFVVMMSLDVALG